MEETLASSMDVELSPGAENVMFHTATILAATAPTTRAFDDEPPLFASSSLTLESRSLLERNPPLNDAICNLITFKKYNNVDV